MIITASYGVDKVAYNKEDHRVSLITTEHTYKNDFLVHLRIGRNLGIIINNQLRHGFKTESVLQNDQFLYKKTYSHGNVKPVTRSAFEDKLKHFDISKTVIEQEILEDYTYIGSDGSTKEVQIVITAKGDTVTATIDFKDAEQHKNFVSPAWLVTLGS